MRTTLIAIWVVSMIVFCYLSYKFCCNGGALVTGQEDTSTVSSNNTNDTDNSTTDPSTTAATVAAASFFSVGSGDWSVQCPTGSFLKSSADPLAEKTEYEESFKKLASFQKENPNQVWTIVGKYAEGEENNSIYPNLGEARASKIKNLLTGYGIPASALKIQGDLTEGTDQSGTFFRNDTLFDGYAVNIAQASKIEDTKPVETFDNTKPIMLRFNTASDVPIMNATSRHRFSKMIAELERSPNRKIIVTGHTDNIGDPNKNMKLGRERASFIKSYLIKNGIDSDRVEIDSKGQSEPISDDITLNRRVEVKFKN